MHAFIEEKNISAWNMQIKYVCSKQYNKATFSFTSMALEAFRLNKEASVVASTASYNSRVKS